MYISYTDQLDQYSRFPPFLGMSHWWCWFRPQHSKCSCSVPPLSILCSVVQLCQPPDANSVMSPLSSVTPVAWW